MTKPLRYQMGELSLQIKSIREALKLNGFTCRKRNRLACLDVWRGSSGFHPELEETYVVTYSPSYWIVTFDTKANKSVTLEIQQIVNDALAQRGSSR